MNTMFILLLASLIHGEGPGIVQGFKDKAACERAASDIVAFYGGTIDPSKPTLLKWKCLEIALSYDVEKWKQEQREMWKGKVLESYEEKPDKTDKKKL